MSNGRAKTVLAIADPGGVFLITPAPALAAWLVRLSCGHAYTTDNPPPRGGWISCWPGQLPFTGCQCQVRVVEVTGL